MMDQKQQFLKYTKTKKSNQQQVNQVFMIFYDNLCLSALLLSEFFEYIYY